MIDLRELKKAKKFENPLLIEGNAIKNWKELKKFWEDNTNYDLDEYCENEPYLMTLEELKGYYCEISSDSGAQDWLLPYLNIEAMINNDMQSGYLQTIDIDGEKYYYRIY